MKPTSGTARIFGFDIRHGIMEIRKRASLLPQEASVYEALTARENILYYGQIHGNLSNETLNSRTDELIDLIGLRRRANDVTKEFSGGMKRKVLVARALVMDPDLIFLDEPTTGIDILGARTVRTVLKKLSKELHKTIIMTTHDLTDIEELCDRVGIMVRGKLAAIGRPDDLEQQFRKADIEDIYIGLATGEGVLEEEELDASTKRHPIPALISRITRRK